MTMTSPAPLSTSTDTVRLTTAQALVQWMVAQRSQLLDGTEVTMFAGVFGIFGHGNVLGLGTALQEVRDHLPTYRGHTEQGAAFFYDGNLACRRARRPRRPGSSPPTWTPSR